MKIACAVLISLSLILHMMTTLSVLVVNAQVNRIYLDPSNNFYDTNTAYIGMKFNVTVWVEDSPDIGAFQVHLRFNDTILNVTRWFEPKWDAQYIFSGKTTSALPSPPDPGYVHLGPGLARVQVGANLFPTPPTQPPSSGTGKLCIFEFNITALPSPDETLSCTLNINTTDTYLVSPEGAKIHPIKENGNYRCTSPPPPPPWLEASPSEYEAIKPRPFNMSILIKNVTEIQHLVAVQFQVKYNASYLNVTHVYDGPFLKTWATHGTAVTYWIEDYLNRVVYGEIMLPNATGYWDMPTYPSGEGVVATITFEPLLHKEVTFNITIEPLFGRMFLDKNGEWLSYLEPKPCLYTYTPLTKPLLNVQPVQYIASHLGETFEINITINGLDARWNMTYAEFKLVYDNASLQLLDVHEGDFLSQFGNTVFHHTEGDDYTKVNITLTPTGDYPSGSGTLATVRFNVTSSPGRSTLVLNNTKLLDFEMKDVLHEAQDGYYQLHEVLIHSIVWETKTFNIMTVSNTSVAPVPMNFNQTYKLLWFNVTGYDGTVGFVNITIPKALLNASITDWYVIVGGWPVQPIVVENATHTMLYFTFNSSVNSVYILGTWVVPEIPTSVLLLALLIISLAGFAFAKKVRLQKCRESLPSRTFI
jgi:hypothetical protein